jgi:glycosyltransferase involved in cell wall biosynthesis
MSSLGARATIALLPWGTVIEDFLDPNGISLESFSQEFSGSWMFSYVEALAAAGVDTVIICVSLQTRRVIRTRHAPTGAQLVFLPVPRRLRALRRRGYVRTYGGTRDTEARRQRRIRGRVGSALSQAAPYLATPVTALARELRRAGCSAILCQEYEFPRFDVCVALSQLIRIPTFGVYQGGDYQRWRVEGLVRPRAIRRSAGLIIGSAAEESRVRTRYGVDGAKVARIPNPLDLELWAPGDRKNGRALLGLADDVTVVIWHGRVEIRKKGLDTLLEAWRTVVAERPTQDVALALVGSGADDGDLRALLADGGLDRVVWIDRLVHDRTQLRDLLSAGDLYVFPSRQEGFPMALMEALACGLPAVAAEASGVREILGDGAGTAGVVVDSDAPRALADGLSRLLDDQSLRAAYAAAARPRAVAEFGLARVGERLREFVLPGPR